MYNYEVEGFVMMLLNHLRANTLLLITQCVWAFMIRHFTPWFENRSFTLLLSKGIYENLDNPFGVFNIIICIF